MTTKIGLQVATAEATAALEAMMRNDMTAAVAHARSFLEAMQDEADELWIDQPVPLVA